MGFREPHCLPSPMLRITLCYQEFYSYSFYIDFVSKIGNRKQGNMSTFDGTLK